MDAWMHSNLLGWGVWILKTYVIMVHRKTRIYSIHSLTLITLINADGIPLTKNVWRHNLNRFIINPPISIIHAQVLFLY